jgi:hypothetical protein
MKPPWRKKFAISSRYSPEVASKLALPKQAQGTPAMHDNDLNGTDAHTLARILDLEDTSRRIWSGEELHAILKHQLATGIQFDLENLGPAYQARLRALPASAQPGKLTFGELFESPSPSLELLKLTKQFAKASRISNENALPAEIATALYLASIVVARIRLGERISAQTDESLVNGIQWVLDQPWIREPLRGLFRTALTRLRSAGRKA